MRLRILNLLLFLCLSSLVLPAQKSVCKFSLPVQYTFRYSEREPEFSAVSNEMIAVIAEDAVKNRRSISFTLNTHLQFRLEQPAGRNPMTRISIGPQSLSGNIFFRKFSMTSVMMPNRLAFGCRIEKKDSTSFFEFPETSNRLINEKDSFLLQCQVPHFSCDSDTVVVSRLRFYFDQDVLEHFRKRVTLINDYYAASAILDSLGNEVQKLNLGAIDLYPRYFIFLEEVNKILAIIKERKLVQRLELDSFDPEGFQIKFNNLSRFSRSATMTFRENLKTPGALNFPYSTDSLIREFLDRMGRYIRWSMLVSERNSNIYHEFLDSYFRINAFADEKEVIRNLVEKMFPGQDPDSAQAGISLRLTKAYHDRAEELMRNLSYAEAVELLGNARNFSNINPYLKETSSDRKIISKAANGIYNSYLGVAEDAIRNGKLEMARSYLVRAQVYRKEHAPYVTSDSLFNKVFRDLVAENLSRCDTLFSTSYYAEALECYRGFEMGFDSLTLSSVQRVLQPKIQFCRYKILISEGVRNLAKPDKPEAGRNFFLARQLSQDAKFGADSLLDSLCRVTYPFYLIHLLNVGESRIWANRLESARIFADSIAFLQRTTGAESSRELSDALAGYRRKVEERTCWNATETVEVLLLRARRERELRDFISANSLTDSAVSVAAQFSDCAIQLTGGKDTAVKYLEALEFQRMLKQVELRITTNRFKDAVEGFLEMENYNRSHDIGRFGISIPPMYDYIYNKSIQDLTLQALFHFKEKNDPVMAFRYLKLLRLQDYPRKSAKEPLEWLGRELARMDFRDRPDSNPVNLVRNYTGRDNWMKRFRFAYYNQARELRHKPVARYLLRKFFP